MFHLVYLLVFLGEPNIYQNLVCFTMCVGFYLEELGKWSSIN
ncbi:uncharacterized protein METZ01_LOCUS248620 [marine metagenome]|uniref:Uncharacterized protein n=1 Tax=marine metagenome TaxID=408172 RepID=A0A382I814_9ZZZZ